MFAVIPKRLLEKLRFKISSGYRNIHFAYSTQALVNHNTTSGVKEYGKSFTVSYLIESCGLSSENAILAAKKVQFETPERPDSVLTLLKNQGFPSTHIAKVVKTLPSLLLCKEPEKSLLPKLEFLRSIGLSGIEITKIVTKDPNILRVLAKNFQTNVIPNFKLLRVLEVPRSSLAFLVTQFPDTAFMPHKKFIQTVEGLKRMGFDPRKSMFVYAIQAFFAIGRETFGKKFERYIQWGLSMDEALMAFKRQPRCMALSDQKIQMTMDLLINKMGWSPDLVAKYPVVLCLSLEKRVKPRCSVFQVLVSRNLVKKDMSIGSLMIPGEETFMKKCVTKFLGTVPELMDVYQGKVDASTLVNDSCPAEA